MDISESDRENDRVNEHGTNDETKEQTSNISKESTGKENKSIVWKYFKKEDAVSSRCILCTKVLKNAGNTTNLMQHLKRKHLCHLESNSISKRQKISVSRLANKNIEKRICENEEEEIDNPGPSNIDVPSCSMQRKSDNSKERIDDAFHRINSFKGKIILMCNFINILS